MLRLRALGALSFYYDELFVTRLHGATLHNVALVLTGTAFDDQHPPLYYLVALFWTGAMGTSELAVRLLSALCSLATLPVVYLLGTALHGRRTGALAALLLAALPVHVYYAREARMYALLALLATASTLALVHLGGAARNGRRAGLAPYAVLATGLALTHYFGALAVAAQGALVALRSRREAPTAGAWLAVFAVPMAAFVPFAVVAAWQATHRDHAYLDFDARALRDLVCWLGGAHPRLPVVCALPLLALALYGAAMDAHPAATTEPLPGLPPPARWERRLCAAGALIATAAAVLLLGHGRALAYSIAALRVASGEEASLAADQGAVAVRALTLGALAAALAAAAILFRERLAQGIARRSHAGGRPWPDPLGSPSRIAYVLIAVPLAVTLVAGMVGVPLLHVHNFIAAAPLVALLGALGLEALPTAWRTVGCVALVAGFIFVDTRLGAVPGVDPARARGWVEHTYADWRALRAVVPDGDPAAVVTVQSFATDAVMHYLAAHDVVRLLPGDDGGAIIGQVQTAARGGGVAWATGRAFGPPAGTAFWWVDPSLANDSLAAQRVPVARAVQATAWCRRAAVLPQDAVVYRCVAR